MIGEGSSPATIEARGWGWRHPGRREWALRSIDLRVEPGERVLLLGPSGSGKSTFLAGVAGLLDLAGGGEAAGRLLVDDRDATAMRDRTGLLFQDPEAQIVMGRAGDEVAFGLENRCVPTAEIWPRVDAALEAVGFAYPRQRATHALSGGEKQRLALAGTLALQPGLLLLDEPTANLDPPGAAALRDLLQRTLASTGMTMVLVEHRVAESLPLVDRLVVLAAGGRLIADGSPEEVLARQGDALAEAGVWVPDRPPPGPVQRPRPAAEPLILAERAGFTYPGASASAIDRVDLTLRSAEALAITGANGSGKSTLAMLLAGLLRPSAGRVVAAEALAAGRGGEQVADWPARELVRRIGTVFQDPEHAFLTSSVLAELMLGPMRAGMSEVAARRRADELLERLHLDRLAGANPFTLSGGEKRRLSVATALATAPSLLILDEPTFGQDRRTWSELLALLAGLRDDGRGVCIVSHDGEFVRQLADRALQMSPVGTDASGRAVAAVR